MKLTFAEWQSMALTYFNHGCPDSPNCSGMCRTALSRNELANLMPLEPWYRFIQKAADGKVEAPTQYGHAMNGRFDNGRV